MVTFKLILTFFIASVIFRGSRGNIENRLEPNILEKYYKAFHRFGQAKFPKGGLVLSSSQFLILPQLPQKMMVCLKVVKIDSKISNSRR
jgi:hypothetical protein